MAYLPDETSMALKKVSISQRNNTDTGGKYWVSYFLISTQLTTKNHYTVYSND